MNRALGSVGYRFLLACAVVTITPCLSLRAATEEVLYSFQGGKDAAWPEAGVIFDNKGNLYGTTRNFGPHGYGAVYQLSPSPEGWNEKILHGFCASYRDGCLDGAYPIAGVVFDDAGNLYGTASEGGGNAGWGTVYQLTKSVTWNETVLCALDCLGDSYPAAEVTLDRAGRIFASVAGNRVFGGQGDVFELRLSDEGGWDHRTLYDFQFGGGDGNHPSTALAIDRHHHLFGMTVSGGTYGLGTVFEVAPRPGGAWIERPIFNLSAFFGSVGGVTLDKSGNLFCTAGGIVFELTPVGNNWTETDLYTFADGEGGVLSRLTIDKDGDLFGTARKGGLPGCANGLGCGSVYELTKTETGWQKSTIYQFTGGADGGNPVGGVTLDQDGNMYGATNWGGVTACLGIPCGVVYKITP